MTKYTLEERLQSVLAYLEGKASFESVAQQFKVGVTPLKTWVASYRENGMEGLLQKLYKL